MQNLAPYVNGDRIGVMYVVLGETNRKLEFYKNGMKVGEVNNVSASLTLKLYPQVTFYTPNDSMTLLPNVSPETNKTSTSEKKRTKRRS